VHVLNGEVPDSSIHDDDLEHHHHGMTDRLLHLVRPHSHAATGFVDDAVEGSSEGIRAVKLSLVILGLTAALQAVLVWLTGSVALLADTIHNVADALTALPLWVAFALSSRAATRRYTYGYGRAEDLAGIFIVAMIALSAVLAAWESVSRLIAPRPLAYPWVVMAAGVIGFLGNEAVATYRIRVGRRIGSAALVADGIHARTDGFTSLAVVLGALGALVGLHRADPVVGILITVAIVFVLKDAARSIYYRLMDAIEPELIAQAEDCLNDTPGVRDVDDLRLRWVGDHIRGEASVVVDADATLETAHAIATDAEHRLLHQVPKLIEVTIHVSPGGDLGTRQHQVISAHPAGCA
jgi:cation diffusion facilitator family transporter